MVKNFQFMECLFPVIPQASIPTTIHYGSSATTLATEEATYLMDVEISTKSHFPPRVIERRKER